MELLREEIPASPLVVTVDPGKAFNRVWLTTGEQELIGIEATGSLHRAWAAEVERRWPGSLRLFAPSETAAARAQLGSRRIKTDERDCAALVWLMRQGAGRPSPRPWQRSSGRSVAAASSSTSGVASNSACMTS